MGTRRVADLYGMQLSHVFEIPAISNETPSFSIEILIISTKNKWVFRIRNFEILGFTLEFEILGVLSEIPSILKTWNFD